MRETQFVDAVLGDYGFNALDAHQNGDIAWLPDDPITWIEKEFWIPETNAPIQLVDYQVAALERALARDGDEFRYSLILWSDLKKSAKSTIAAAVVLWLAWHYSWESCRVVGNDLKQAASRTFFYIERALKLNPKFAAHIVHQRTYHIQFDNFTTIEAIATDPKGEAGGGDLIVCFTELWAAKTEAAKQLWTETTLSPLKFGKSLRFCESYAGFDGQSPILEQLYQAGVKSGTPIDVGIDGLELYENPAARMLCLWNTIPRCDWQSPSYYAQESAVLTPSEFSRIHRNEWQQSDNPFVPIAWYDACAADPMPALRPLQPMVIALDAAVSNDCFGIVAVTRTDERIEVRHARKWQPEPGQKLHYTDPAGDKENTEYPEGYLRWLVRTYHCACVTYDEMQLHDFCTRLANEHLAYFEVFPQGHQRLVADKQFYDVIKNAQIVHDGNPDLRDHIRNANRTDEDADKMRIVKRAPHLKIDLAVCVSQAVFIAKKWNIG